MPIPPDRLGDADGMNAGNGMADGLGETERLILCPTCELTDDRLLWEVGGAVNGIARDCGVPGADGRGEPSASVRTSRVNDARCEPGSCGAGLSDEMRRPGRSIFEILLY